MPAKPIPIHFESGSWGTTVDGRVENLSVAQSYSLNARAGQILSMIFDGGGPPDGKSGDSLGVQVFDPRGDLLDETNPHAASPVSVNLPFNGTYNIIVGLDNMEEQWEGTFTLCMLVVNGQRNA
jgi:hypothetical protein